MFSLDCADFDAFEEALFGVQGRYLLRTAQQRAWRLGILDLGSVALMAGREGAGTLYSGVGLPGRFNVFLPLTGHQTTVVDGRRFDRSTIGWMVPDAAFHIDAAEPASWLTLAIAEDHVARWAKRNEDRFDAALLTHNLAQRSHAVAPLLGLVQRLFGVDAEAPGHLQAPQARDAACDELLDAAFDALLPIDDTAAGRTLHGARRRRVLHDALDRIDADESATLHLRDLCAATGASERTVRDVFHEHLGMGPHEYLSRRRLHAMRVAIAQAQPGDTVTGICARFGVWDFGRFAERYRACFGVLPSQALAASRRSVRPGDAPGAEPAVFT